MNLQGALHIKHLERVKSVMNAKEANMSSKCVDKLQLRWEVNEESQLQENVEEILEVLQPQTQQLQSLDVLGYTGSCFPLWMSSPSLKHLNTLQLVHCKSCLHLPHLGKLPSLKSLTISSMSLVKYIDEESCDNGVAGGFIRLEYLVLEKLPNLIALSRDDRESILPNLSKFQITECPELLGLPCLPSLIDMCIRGKCNTDLLSSIHKQVTLESLMFQYNEELTCFPDGMLRNLISLKTFDIFWLCKLEQFPSEILNISTIQEIYITKCDNLKSLADEVLQGLHTLKKLSIELCSGIEGLHLALQHMTSLQSLTLSYLPNLASLPDWLGNLSLLQELCISQCPKLTCLPTSIQCLTGLKSLEIYGCSELGERCKENTGEDWPKIAHVQHIVIQNIGMFCGRGGRSYSVDWWV
ncbi:putative leucine-rich repeat domain, L domain-containing protein [Medicago truncatula]|uniref:Putative leucine-rich repeat domain, L domain-containing protein n=1 Tax=Medicago truncatula TaxID=3880 RepID=A0A396HP38_MEDTR|nr:putative leucine-rich repeat domain, L domain-containing protein [Medicago truncatula]